MHASIRSFLPYNSGKGESFSGKAKAQEPIFGSCACCKLCDIEVSLGT